MQSTKKRSRQDSQAGLAPQEDVVLQHIDSPSSEQGLQLAREHRFRNLYKKAPDFRVIAQLDPDFAKYVKGRELDFNDPEAVKQLTKTLLKLDFDLDIELPDDRLCPPVPNRHNYILWLKDLLDTTVGNVDVTRKAVGLDIGTGASCIYPLLGCLQRPWSFIATDIDNESLGFAKRNITLNNLEHRIQLVSRQPSDPLIPVDQLPRTLDFLMTNPPFYASSDELSASAAKKSLLPSTACTGAPVEMVTPGGEVSFVSRIISESLVLRERVTWYTAMVGFLSSLSTLVEKLKAEGVENYAVTEFVQGSKTRRWAVAWSFGGWRPKERVARGLGGGTVSKGLLPPSTEVKFTEEIEASELGGFVDQLSERVGELDLGQWEWDKQTLVGLGKAPDKVWGRAWRRMKKRQEENKEPMMTDGVESRKKSLGFQITVRIRREEVVILCRWLEGHDAAVFESFTGFIKTTIESIRPKKE
ncbi:U6 small nuclear RNA (adenine-(43)-N(6))-methyltransferase [Sarocladium implicatum]|nr:U6 small nuclear RNA (adenine-(43)-N(6))-methyltransferase [Sarocladium implicatum]